MWPAMRRKIASRDVGIGRSRLADVSWRIASSTAGMISPAREGMRTELSNIVPATRFVNVDIEVNLALVGLELLVEAALAELFETFDYSFSTSSSGVVHGLLHQVLCNVC